MTPCGSREHCTWQGKLIWQNKNLEAVFHSVLELLQLLDEILSEQGRVPEWQTEPKAGMRREENRFTYWLEWSE